MKLRNVRSTRSSSRAEIVDGADFETIDVDAEETSSYQMDDVIHVKDELDWQHSTGEGASESVVCNICLKEWSSLHQLQRHKYRVHKIIPRSELPTPSSTKVDTKPALNSLINRKTTNMFTPKRENRRDLKNEMSIEEASTRPTYGMVGAAIEGLKDALPYLDQEASLQAIKKYIASNYKIDVERYAHLIKKALTSILESGSIKLTKIIKVSNNTASSTKPSKYEVIPKVELIEEEEYDFQTDLYDDFPEEQQLEPEDSADEFMPVKKKRPPRKKKSVPKYKEDEDGSTPKAEIDTTKTVECEECGKMLSNKKHLYKHRSKAHRSSGSVKKESSEPDGNRHHKKGIRTCFVCPRTFPSFTPLVGHLGKEHNESSWENFAEILPTLEAEELLEGDISRYLLPKSDTNEDLLESIENKIAKTCGICNLEYDSFASMVSHTRFAHAKVEKTKSNWMVKMVFALEAKWPSPTSPCDMCGKFIKLESLQSHVTNHKNKYKRCNLCEKDIRRKVWKRHKNAHDNMTSDEKKDYNCPTCNVTVHSKNGLRNHMSKHDPDFQKVDCNTCDKKFLTRESASKHMKIVHGKDEREPTKCDRCPFETYGGKSALDSHVRGVHEKITPHLCTQCSYATSVKHNLNSHIRRVHSKEKPYRCEQCPYECCTKLDLTRHIFAIHETEKHPKCEFCPWTSPRPHLVAKHTRNVHQLGQKMWSSVLKKDAVGINRPYNNNISLGQDWSDTESSDGDGDKH